MQPYYKRPKFWARLIVLALLVSVGFVIGVKWHEKRSGLQGYSDLYCNIAKINLHGQLYTYTLAHVADSEATSSTGENFTDEASSEDIVNAIEAVREDDSIRGVLLDIDSPGGSPVGGEEIANALLRLGKPSVALIRDMGDSAAYWAATGASLIIASANSSVGDIGVTSSYLEYAKQNEEQGLDFQQISVGKYKDAGNPNLALSDEAKAIFLRNDKEVYDNFVKAVAANRRLDEAKVKDLADGSDMTGAAAKENGLIDEVGDRESAKQYFTQKIGEEAAICQY